MGRSSTHMHNGMATTGIMNIALEILWRKPNIVGSFSEFGHIAYVTMRGNIKRQTKDKTYKEIIVGYDENQTRDTYKLYNKETKRVIISRYIK